jgi:hypothetical protein
VILKKKSTQAMADSAQRHRNLYKAFVAGQRGGDTRVHGDMQGRQTEGFKLGGSKRSGHAPRVGGGAFWFPLIGLAATAARTLAPAAIRAGVQAGARRGVRAGLGAAGRAAASEAARVAPREVVLFAWNSNALRIGDLTGLTDKALEAGRNLLVGQSARLVGPGGEQSGITVTNTQFGPQISGPGAADQFLLERQQRREQREAPTAAEQAQIDVRRRAIEGRGVTSGDKEMVSNLSRRAAGERMLRRMMA